MSFILRRRIPLPFGAEKNRHLGLQRNGVGRNLKLAHELEIFLAVIIRWRFSRNIPEPKMHAPEPGKNWRRMGYRDRIALPRNVREGEIRHQLDVRNVAMGLAERGAFNLGEILEP